MKYVLDASVAIRWVLPNVLTPFALKLREAYLVHEHDLIAPSVFTGEIANALTKAERQKSIAVGDARELVADVLSVPPRLYSYEKFLWRAVEISSRFRCGFYDCLYIALAESERCELVTADEKLVRSVQATFPFVISLSNIL